MAELNYRTHHLSFFLWAFYFLNWLNSDYPWKMIFNKYLSNNRIYLVDVSTTGHSIEMLSEVLECLKVMLRKFVNESLQLQHSHLEILCAICINEVLIECYITKTSDVLSAVFCYHIYHIHSQGDDNHTWILCIHSFKYHTII